MGGDDGVNSNSQQTRPPKCLLFDRRYGFVYDVWKDPSEEALSGGRGMFCILPLANALIKSASNTGVANSARNTCSDISVADARKREKINHVASSTLKVLKKPDLFTPKVMQVNINSQLERVTSSMKQPGFDFTLLKRRQTFSYNLHGVTNESHNV